MAFLLIPNRIFGFDLLWEITSTIEKQNISSDYMNNFYSSKHSKDPYGDALNTMNDMSMQLKLSWVDYVEKALAEKNCKMSKKKIIGILYYFSPDFRSELSRSLKMKSWNVDSRSYILDGETIAWYCSEYYKCINRDDDKSIRENKEKISRLIAATPDAVNTSCKEFFSKHYEEWKLNEDMSQNVQKSQLWSDKFWNATTDDSPYDIMTDIETVWKFLFQEVEWPITPVFYNLPVFSKSAKSLADSGSSKWNWWNQVDNNWDRWGKEKDNEWWWNNNPNPTIPSEKIDENEKIGIIWWDDPITPKPLWLWSDKVDDVLDDMIEWLVLSDVNWTFKGVICKDEEVESEPEPKVVVSNQNEESDISITEELGLSPEEFQAAVDYMFEAVNKFESLPDEAREKMTEKAWDTSRYLETDGSLSQEQQQERFIDEIKECWEACEEDIPDLRYDQKATCKLMCACGEWKSKIFDPENTPGLWPIAMIKFCTVPWVDGRFSVGWRKMVGIEEWIKEIFWVVDKLSREWKLWIYTQQYNFLDSSTKEMNFFKSMAFSINVDLVNIANRISSQSKQFMEKEASISNTLRQTHYSIKNSLDNPVSKNRYRLVDESVLNDFSASVNPDIVRQAVADTSVETEFIVDQTEVSKYDRYVQLSNYVAMWMDQEWEFWDFTLEWIKDLTDSANLLLSKK